MKETRMTIDEAIDTLNNTAWLGVYKDLEKVAEAVAIAEWCMRKSRKEYERRENLPG